MYLNPLRKQTIITAAHVKSIFSELEVILNYNSLLLKEVEAKVQHWSHSSCLGTTFLKLVCPPSMRGCDLKLFLQTDFLKVYTQYVNNFPKALTTLNACKQKPAFKSFLTVSILCWCYKVSPRRYNRNARPTSRIMIWT